MDLPAEPPDPSAILASGPLESLRRALGGAPAFLVGGSVRDLLLGRPTGGDLDVAVEGELGPILTRLEVPTRRHERFGTATVEVDGVTIDLARTRSERYRSPGALPEVEPAPLEQDLARRDFTINAMALPLDRAGALIDPHAGSADLERGLLRVLHERSFLDDPTRALRAARYAARFGFGLEGETASALRKTDLGSVSTDRRDAEVRRLAAEADPVRPFVLLDSWGLMPVAGERLELARSIAEWAGSEAWLGTTARGDAVLAAVCGDAAVIERAEALSASEPERPSQAVALAAGADETVLLVARALGAGWVDEYRRSWSRIGLEIDGSDLLAAGVAEGPAVGRGLAAARRARLDGEIGPGREGELQVALRAARSAPA